MTIIRSFLFITAAVCFAACGGARESISNTNSGPDRSSLPGTPAPTNTTSSNSNSTNANTANPGESFWKEAAAGGIAEVELGKLAQTKAQNAEVKRFAQMMVAEHTKSNDELRSLAMKKNIVLPTAPEPRHQAAMQEMQNRSGAEFDRAYVDAMVRDHESAVQLFESQAQSGTDAEAKEFAVKTLPTLRQHLETIKGIKEKLN